MHPPDSILHLAHWHKPRLLKTRGSVIYFTYGSLSLHSWMRPLTGAPVGISSAWLAFPYAEAAFADTREASDLQPAVAAPAADRHEETDSWRL
jgi:hypothetical protein